MFGKKKNKTEEVKSVIDTKAQEANNWCNTILEFLATKHIGQWTQLQVIENHFKDSIAGYNVTTSIDKMYLDKYLDYSRNMSEYKINSEGRHFLSLGGYK